MGLKIGEGYKGQTDVKVQSADCKYSGENACRITAWAQDYAGNNSFGTEYMMTRIYSIDFGPPQAKITGISPLPTFPVAGEAWLRAEDGGAQNRKHTFTVEYTDDALKQCEFHVYNNLVLDIKTTSCNGLSKKTATFDIWVGPNSGADCSVESGILKTPTCRIEAKVWDKADNAVVRKSVPLLRGDFAIPGNEPNIFPLQVDWQKPSAR